LEVGGGDAKTGGLGDCQHQFCKELGGKMRGWRLRGFLLGVLLMEWGKKGGMRCGLGHHGGAKQCAVNGTKVYKKRQGAGFRVQGPRTREGGKKMEGKTKSSSHGAVNKVGGKNQWEKASTGGKIERLLEGKGFTFGPGRDTSDRGKIEGFIGVGGFS